MATYTLRSQYREYEEAKTLKAFFYFFFFFVPSGRSTNGILFVYLVLSPASFFTLNKFCWRWHLAFVEVSFLLLLYPAASVFQLYYMYVTVIHASRCVQSIFACVGPGPAFFTFLKNFFIGYFVHPADLFHVHPNPYFKIR